MRSSQWPLAPCNKLPERSCFFLECDYCEFNLHIYNYRTYPYVKCGVFCVYITVFNIYLLSMYILHVNIHISYVYSLPRGVNVTVYQYSHDASIVYTIINNSFPEIPSSRNIAVIMGLGTYPEQQRIPFYLRTNLATSPSIYIWKWALYHNALQYKYMHRWQVPLCPEM